MARPHAAEPLSPLEVVRLGDLRAALPPAVATIRLNGNRKTLLSLRGQPGRGLALSLHRGLLAYHEALAAIPRWAAKPSRGVEPVIRAALDDLFRHLGQQHLRTAPALAAPDLPPLGGPFDAEAALRRVRDALLPDLDLPPIAWGPQRAPAKRRRIRFGAYHRHPPRILLNRRLDQPWVARAFAEFVVYHELCHHAQARSPVRGETPHSRRFKAWEARWPDLPLVLAWERAHLHRFLDPDALEA